MKPNHAVILAYLASKSSKKITYQELKSALCLDLSIRQLKNIVKRYALAGLISTKRTRNGIIPFATARIDHIDIDLYLSRAFGLDPVSSAIMSQALHQLYRDARINRRVIARNLELSYKKVCRVTKELVQDLGIDRLEHLKSSTLVILAGLGMVRIVGDSSYASYLVELSQFVAIDPAYAKEVIRFYLTGDREFIFSKVMAPIVERMLSHEKLSDITSKLGIEGEMQKKLDKETKRKLLKVIQRLKDEGHQILGAKVSDYLRVLSELSIEFGDDMEKFLDYCFSRWDYYKSKPDIYWMLKSYDYLPLHKLNHIDFLTIEKQNFYNLVSKRQEQQPKPSTEGKIKRLSSPIGKKGSGVVVLTKNNAEEE